MMGSKRLILFLLALCLAGGAAPGSAQLRGLGFDLKMGYSALGGEYGDALDDGVDAELNVYYGLEHLRLGWGVNLVSYGFVEAEEDAEVDSASQVGMQFSVAYPFHLSPRFKPYVEARLTWDRFRGEGHVEGFPPPEDEGENTTPTASGWGGTAVAGVFVGITETLFADFSGRWGRFSTTLSDFSYVGAPDVADGTRWGVRTGLVWYW
jgi:hypothetical protein